MKARSFGFLALALSGAACGSAPAPSESSSSSSALSAALHTKVVQEVTQTNLVSDQAGVAATTDPNLVNAWGIAFNPKGPAWVSNNGTGTSTVYSSTGALLLTVTVPPPASSPAGTLSAPTGQVFNATTDFAGDLFIFATEDGTVSGWQPTTGTVLQIDNSAGGKESAVYKGIAMGPSLLYVTNFRDGKIEVYDAKYAPTTVAGDFVDPYLPCDYAPFNVFVDGTRVFVSYARQDAAKHDDVAGAGSGYVSLFDEQGHFQQRLVSGGALNSPWGMAIAPATAGALAGELLVGNFGDGRINVYNLKEESYGGLRVTYKGLIGDTRGKPLAIDGLWAVAFSPETDGSRLYFSAGPDKESHGLYGRLDMPAAGDE
jgi:uncharacterized protein (TIGR03118 family)